MAEALIWVESVDGDVRIAGYVAHPGQNRSNNRMQYLFLNGRHIRDRSLQHALGEAYRGHAHDRPLSDRRAGPGNAASRWST